MQGSDLGLHRGLVASDQLLNHVVACPEKRAQGLGLGQAGDWELRRPGGLWAPELIRLSASARSP